jgi:chaperonin cofactor prefoldin
VEAVDREIADAKERMEALKAVLYAKFGRSINLDTDE